VYLHIKQNIDLNLLIVKLVDAEVADKGGDWHVQSESVAMAAGNFLLGLLTRHLEVDHTTPHHPPNEFARGSFDLPCVRSKRLFKILPNPSVSKILYFPYHKGINPIVSINSSIFIFFLFFFIL
jgi:hypothetical protein